MSTADAIRKFGRTAEQAAISFRALADALRREPAPLPRPWKKAR